MRMCARDCKRPAVTGSPNCAHHGGQTPSGMIGLACGDLARYSDFTPSMMALQKPANCGFKMGKGLGPAQPFNGIARSFLANPKYQWLFLTNDDNICPPDTIYRLMEHDVDVVSGLYFGRIMPFEPILFDKWTWEAGDQELHAPDCDSRKNNVEVAGCDCGIAEDVVKKRWWHRHLMQPGEKGLVKASAVGDGCLLIKRKVIEALSDPWWEYGETFTDVCDHDVVFSRKVTEAGFGLYCDLDLLIGHITPFTVMPHRRPDGTWEAHLRQDDDVRYVALPAASKE